jgi:hypothetical protein
MSVLLRHATRLFDDPTLYGSDKWLGGMTAIATGGAKNCARFGCGTGIAAACPAEVFGLDPAVAMLTTARQGEGGSLSPG